MIDLREVTNEFLTSKDYENWQKRYDGVTAFKASSAGTCRMKNWFDFHDDKFRPVTEWQSSLKLSLGNSVHDTIQTALLWYEEEGKLGDDVKLFIEERVTDEELNLAGHLDIMLVDFRSMTIYLRDIKTAGNRSYQKIFGNKKYRELNSNLRNKLQIGTYGLMVMRKIERLHGKNHGFTLRMYLDYYKKDNSMLRSVEVGPEYVQKAEEYWTKQNDFMKDVQSPEEALAAIEYIEEMPIHSWMCNYCDFADKCPIYNMKED